LIGNALRLSPRPPESLFSGPAFPLAMAHQTIRGSERLIKLSVGSCDLNDVAAILDRIVAVSVMALTGGEAEKKPPAKLVARDVR
jgi:hypothetical protein